MKLIVITDETDERVTYCDGCGATTYWEDLDTDDDGDTWYCPVCAGRKGGGDARR